MIDKITAYESLRLSWNKSIEELGNMIPSNNGHTSIFMYPYNYKFNKNSKTVIENLTSAGWVYHKKNSDDFHKVEIPSNPCTSAHDAIAK